MKNNKNIAKVVFYEDEETKEILTCLFFTDGTIKETTYEEGITYAIKFAKKAGIKTKEELKKLITDTKFPYIYAISKKTLEDNLSTFIEDSKKQGLNKKSIKIKTKKDKIKTKKRKNVKNIIIKIANSKLAKKAKNIVIKIANTKRVQKIRKFVYPTYKYLYKKVIAIVTAIAILVTGVGGNLKNIHAEKLNNKKTKARTESNNSTSNNNINNSYTKGIDDYYNQKNNKAYNNYNFNKLLSTTTNQNQYNIMKRIGNYLDYFNGTFAEAYLEDGKNIKAALNWEESIALSIAFNDYTRKQIQAIFNGYEADATDLNNAYKNAILQLMGAYIIENRSHPVNLYKMLENPEEQAFVQKYEELFSQCKEATGQDQINKVNALYTELFKDLPISDDIREVGIAHTDSRNNLTSYKLAITPIIAASEAMFQSLEIDHTLSDKAIAYFNDIGLCNIADNKFEQAMYISITNDEDENIPTYQQFRKAKIKELKNANRYVTTDGNRDLSQLESFKNWVNPSSSKNINTINGGVYYTTDTYQTTSTRTESSTSYHTETTTEETTDRNKAISKVGEEKVSEAEKAVDEQISRENEKAKRKGMLEAEKRAKKEQAKEDRKAKKKKEQVKNSNEDLQEKINKANQQIDNNKNLAEENQNNINGSDFGNHGVEFDDEHNNNGVLNNSVENITTDGSQADQQLPDSNQTGAEFDNQAANNTNVGVEESIDTTLQDQQYVEQTGTDATINTAEENVPQQDTSYIDTTNVVDAGISQEQQVEEQFEQQVDTSTYETQDTYPSEEEIVNQYVEDLANTTQTDDENFSYVKK